MTSRCMLLSKSGAVHDGSRHQVMHLSDTCEDEVLVNDTSMLLLEASHWDFHGSCGSCMQLLRFVIDLAHTRRCAFGAKFEGNLLLL